MNPNSGIWRAFLREQDIENVRAEVLLQIEKREGLFYERLSAVESWAGAKLRMVGKKADAPGLLQIVSAHSNCCKTETRLRFVEWRDLSHRRSDHGERTPVAPIVNDYLAYRRGTASAACIERVKIELADPSSELSQVLQGMVVSRCNRAGATDGDASLTKTKTNISINCARQTESNILPFRPDVGTIGTLVGQPKPSERTSNGASAVKVAAAAAAAVAGTAVGSAGGTFVVAVIAACVSGWLKLLNDSHDDTKK